MTIFLYYNKIIIATVFLILVALLLSCSVYASNQEASTTSPICGNGIQETGEQCDGLDLGGASCVSQGFSGGTLLCASSCTFNTSSCTSGGGGGGGGGGFVPPPLVTSVIFSGRAYPQSSVTLLKDAQIVATTTAGADANFQISISGLSAGNYIFSVYTKDKTGRRSSLLTFQVSVTKGATTSITGIFVAPTITVNKSVVKHGDSIAIFGQSVPESEITIAINSAEEIFVKAQADNSGAYLYNFDTALLEMGEHFTKSRAAFDGEISLFGKTVGFAVGTETIAKEEQEQEEQESLEGNLNDDDRVNLVDFSIMAYWYGRFSPPDNVDLNDDHKIDLVDFSIMAYYWTG
jgi:hypothetical protein